MGTKSERNVPWVGMPVQMDPNGEIQYLSRQYSDSIMAAGGLSIAVPLLEEPERARQLIENLDGLLLTGNNSDLDPARYGAPRQEACGPSQPLRDDMDFFLLEAAMVCGIPVLAICFGAQCLNVFLGGSLIQDIPSEIENSIRHSRPESGSVPRHKIGIAPESLLEGLAGGIEATVNSTHHQAVDRLGRGLKAVAWAPDGVIEAVSATDEKQWLLGVQWHPEKSFNCDDFSRNLFEHFLARCRAVRGIDEGTDS